MSATSGVQNGSGAAAAAAGPRSAGTVVTELVATLGRLGVTQAYGVSGGAMAALWDALSAGPIGVHHFRHESGAMFAAIEASFAGGRPVAVFTTTGPGLVNALTGVLAAQHERARVILISPYTSAAARGRFPIQETTRETMPDALYAAGPLFHVAAIVDRPDGLASVEAALAERLGRRTGCVAHLAIDTATQRAPRAHTPSPPVARSPAPATTPPAAAIAQAVAALGDGSFASWCGFGARDAAAEIATLARRMRAPVMCSPRGKGIFPEDDPLFVGVTGLAGHASVMRYLEDHAPRRLLVVGSRLGESTSFWDERFVRPAGFVHVDVDPDVPGRAFPDAPTLALIGDAGATLRALLAELRPAGAPEPQPLPHPELACCARRRDGAVRPEALMDALQDHVVDGGPSVVLAESGHSFLWATHRLRFRTPHRYRLSTNVGSMGHAAAGVVGVALATRRRAVAVVGDGAALMTNEIHTAVTYRAPATWVVLNDARYGMCAQGMQALGLTADAEFPPVDFAAFARAQGCPSVRVDHEHQLDDALAAAMAADGPFLVDVRIDPACQAPASRRNAALAARLALRSERTFPTA